MNPLIFGRPTWVTVNQAALKWNIEQVRKLIGKERKILAVVKADAYGHGMVACAETFLQSGADSLGVATVEEAVECRRAGIQKPLVVFGITQEHETEAIVQLELEPTVVSLRQLYNLNLVAKRLGRRVRVHLKIDTGMGRIGIGYQEAGQIGKVLLQCDAIELAGVYTHFAYADGQDKKLLKQQLKRLAESRFVLDGMGFQSACYHAANSAAVIESPDAYLDMVRPGLMLYGLYPAKRFSKKVELKPALAWQTRIVQLKEVRSGVGLSYGHTFVTKKKALIATLPVGYADGYSRALSNKGRVLVHGVICPVVGRVCMDMTLVDVSNVKDVAVGADVCLIGQQQQKSIGADDLAKLTDTISYEVVCTIGKRVTRRYNGSTA